MRTLRSVSDGRDGTRLGTLALGSLSGERFKLFLSTPAELEFSFMGRPQRPSVLTGASFSQVGRVGGSHSKTGLRTGPDRLAGAGGRGWPVGPGPGLGRARPGRERAAQGAGQACFSQKYSQNTRSFFPCSVTFVCQSSPIGWARGRKSSSGEVSLEARLHVLD